MTPTYDFYSKLQKTFQDTAEALLIFMEPLNQNEEKGILNKSL